MAFTQTNDNSELQFTVDLYDTGNSQVLAGAISYVFPLTYVSQYIIGGTEEDPEPGTDALLASLKSFFEGADYSWYGANVEFHAFHAARRTVATADISPA